MAKAGGEPTTTWIRYSEAKALAGEYLGDATEAERDIRKGLAAKQIPWQCVRFDVPEGYSGPRAGDANFWREPDNLAMRLEWLAIKGDSARHINGAVAKGIDLGRNALVKLRLLPPTTPPKKRARRLTPTEVVARQVFPPDGMPPDTLSTAKALQRLAKRLEQLGILSSDDTMRRATKRR
jgi:hypothetical protein